MTDDGRGLTPRAAEYFPTPRWVVSRLLEARDLPGGAWIEPCVGEGAIVSAVDSIRSDVAWTANDIRDVSPRDEYRAHWKGDFATFSDPRAFWDVGITNPPFSKALGIANAMLRYCDAVAMLAPLAWASGNERLSLMRSAPCDVLVLPDRPWDFVRVCAWFCWPTQGHGFRILESTPLAERKRDRDALCEFEMKAPGQAELFGGSS